MDFNVVMHQFALLVGRLLARRWIEENQQAQTENSGKDRADPATCLASEGITPIEGVESQGIDTVRRRESNLLPDADR